jgi:isoquinoline 1-oxidoreductase beta subunit
VGDDIDRRHDRDHVAGGEDGAGFADRAAADPAEELDADWSKVRIVPSPASDKVYGNPQFGGLQYTAGSATVTGYYKNLRCSARRCGRFARQCRASVERTVAELTTEPSMVVHAKSGRRLELR